jgi:hypothetical protein
LTASTVSTISAVTASILQIGPGVPALLTSAVSLPSFVHSAEQRQDRGLVGHLRPDRQRAVADAGGDRLGLGLARLVGQSDLVARGAGGPGDGRADTLAPAGDDDDALHAILP